MQEGILVFVTSVAGVAGISGVADVADAGGERRARHGVDKSGTARSRHGALTGHEHCECQQTPAAAGDTCCGRGCE